MFNVRKTKKGKYELYGTHTGTSYFIFNDKTNAILVSAVMNFDIDKEKNYLKSPECDLFLVKNRGWRNEKYGRVIVTPPECPVFRTFIYII